MPVVAYIANQFPSAVEPYVQDEIRELRRLGTRVIACTARSPKGALESLAPDLILHRWNFLAVMRSIFLVIRKVAQFSDLLSRIFFHGHEPASRRLRCLVHTALGVYYAVRLRPFQIDHIHAHHGYFSSWVAMVAARLLNVGFSFTLHGSDLLLHAEFLDTKLANCDFCVTISEYNRVYLLKNFPEAAPAKIVVQHLGVDRAEPSSSPLQSRLPTCLVLFAIGRLHSVKNHAFLIEACAQLRRQGTDVFCLIAGDGPERQSLQKRIASHGLENRVTLLGHVPHEELGPFFGLSDLVVLTSHSEGIPLVLMEAMMRGKVVLAPAITGIPELIEHGRTGFLYQPGSMDSFLAQVQQVQCASPLLADLRRAARAHVLAHFERQTNLGAYADLFLTLVRKPVSTIYESPVLQQI